MSVNLCIDWGNTQVKAAIFDNDALKKQMTFSAESALEQVAHLIEQYHPDKAALAAVAGNDDELAFMIKEKVKGFVMVDGHSRTPINNAYTSPESLGADRLALVTAAHILYPNNNNLVISLGTCITYNLVQKTRTFRGGAISPGLQMRLKAMHAFTERLPEVVVDGDPMLLGYDTESCMMSGAVNGMAAEIDGMIMSYQSQYPDFNAILTGGDAPYFAGKLKSKIFADPDILLKGLNVILNYNVPVPR